MLLLSSASLILLTFLADVGLVRTGTSSNSLLVHLTSGSFIGETSTVNGTDRWLGIPFAQPPLGRLRFKAPVPISTPSTGVQEAVNFGEACPQLPSDTTFGPQGEDCLTLNVWRPAGASSSEKLPVLVWFYVSISNVCGRAIFNWLFIGWGIYARVYCLFYSLVVLELTP